MMFYFHLLPTNLCREIILFIHNENICGAKSGDITSFVAIRPPVRGTIIGAEERGHKQTYLSIGDAIVGRDRLERIGVFLFRGRVTIWYRV